MHDDHDLDLIAAYADGDLDGDTSAVEDLVVSCPECRLEFETQREIRAMLQAAPEATMTDAERDSLHQAVLAELEKPAPVIVLESRRRSLRRWMAVGSVAAVTVAVVGLAGILPGLDDAGSETAALNAAGEAAPSSTGLVGQDRMAVQSAESASDTTAAIAAEQADGAAASDLDESAASTVAEPEVPFLAYMDTGPISRQELEANVSNALTALETGAVAEELTVEWFNVNDKPAPECLSAVEDPIYAVINAEVATERLQVLIVRDGETGEYRPESFVLPGCDRG